MNQIQASSKGPRPNKTLQQLALNSGFGPGLSPVRRFSFEEISKCVAIIQNALAKQNLQGPGLEMKIAACAKNRYQITIRGHGVKVRSLSSYSLDPIQ